jgi:hypothetical protein
MGNTVGGFTNGNTFGAVFHFTSFFGAHDLAIRSEILYNLSKSMCFKNLSHLTSQTAFLGSWQEEWHLGGSQTGVQIASHLGSSPIQNI